MTALVETRAVRILFVDDCEDDALLAIAALRRAGMPVEPRVIASIFELAAALDDGPWEAVISDYNLGSATGLDVLRIVRERAGDVPFLILSATVGDERAAAAIRAGADDYVSKDHPVRLAAALARELHAASARAAARELHASLAEAQERYFRTFEFAPVGIAHGSPDGRFLEVNQSLASMLGYEREEMVGRRITEFVHPDEAEESRNAVRDIVNGTRDSVTFERRYFRKDGALICAKVTLAPQRNSAGELHVLGLVEDITAQKASIEKVRMQAQLLDAVDQAVIATDMKGIVTYWNDFAASVFGWSAEQTLGRSIMEVAMPAESEAVAEIIRRLAKGESWTGELVMQRRDGSTFAALVVESPTFDSEGNVAGSVGVAYDLTAQKHVEDELRGHKLQLAEAQDLARIGSWTLDLATQERGWSDALSTLYGFAPGSSPTLEDFYAIVHPDDRERVRALQRKWREELQPVTFDYRIIRGDEIRSIVARVRFVRDAAGRPVKAIGVAQDVTEERQREEELRRRTIQQSAVANLGQLALSGASIEFLLEQAAIAVRTVLDVDLTSVLRKDDGELRLVAGAGWPAAEIGSAVILTGTHSHAELTLELAHAVVMTDVATETRFELSATMRAHGIASGFYVPIYFSDGSAWGALGAHAKRRRHYASHDVEFLSSVAAVIGQAIDRGRADAELRTRARRQTAIAKLAQLVVDDISDEVFDRACEVMIEGAGGDFGYFTELVPGNNVRVRAGKLWGPHLPSVREVSPRMQGGYALLTGESVVVDDYATDTRFDTYDMTVPYGIRSGAIVPVASASSKYGVLAVVSRQARRFGEEEVEFVQTIANMLAEALERQLAHRVIEESEHRYRRIFDGASEIIFTLDSEGRFIALNAAFETLTGWRRQEWLGRPFLELLVEEDRERLSAIFGSMLGDGTAAIAETTLTGKDRKVVVDVSSFPKVEHGAVTEIYGFARDVTETRRATAQRERAMRNLELLLESTVEGIVTIDAEGRGTMVNRAAAAMLQRLPEEFLGHGMHDLMHGSVEVDQCTVFRVLQTGEAATVSADIFVRKDGTSLPVAYSAAPIIDDGRIVGVVVSFSDLSERRKLEARLEQANRLSSLGRLAATVAHEFNNVLMGIAPFVEVIRRAPSPQKVEMSLDHIANSVKRGRRITQDILRFTQPAEPVRSLVEMREWLNAVSIEARSMLPPMYAISISADPVTVEADPSQLHQILMNMILNARDAMPSGGQITVQARREPRDARFDFGAIEDPSRYVHVLVKDEGIGMSAETLRHAFEPLFTTKRNGTGLGLAVTHQVVQRHGGEIFIESTVGEGTTFHIFFPLVEEDASEELAVADPGGEMPSQRAPRHILLVEDDATVAAGLTSLLEYEGFKVSKADSGAAALSKVHDSDFNAVLLDVGLPDMDGRAVYARIAEYHPTLPVIFSTGHADRAQLEELLNKPHVSYLLKPYEVDSLVETLGRVMAS